MVSQSQEQLGDYEWFTESADESIRRGVSLHLIEEKQGIIWTSSKSPARDWAWRGEDSGEPRQSTISGINMVLVGLEKEAIAVSSPMHRLSNSYRSRNRNTSMQHADISMEFVKQSLDLSLEDTCNALRCIDAIELWKRETRMIFVLVESSDLSLVPYRGPWIWSIGIAARPPETCLTLYGLPRRCFSFSISLWLFQSQSASKSPRVFSRLLARTLCGSADFMRHREFPPERHQVRR